MEIELNGVSFRVIADVRREGIIVQGDISDNNANVYVHPRTPHNELIAFLEVYLQKPSPASAISCDGVVDELSLFGQTYTVQVDKNATKPYIQGQSIRTTRFTKGSTLALQKHLLHQYITQLIGDWEDELGFILNEIHIRKLPKNPYVVHEKNLTIVYAERLMLHSLSFIAYVVAKSVFDLRKCPIAQSHSLLTKHVSDWKHNQRVYDFEFRG